MSSLMMPGRRSSELVDVNPQPVQVVVERSRSLTREENISSPFGLYHDENVDQDPQTTGSDSKPVGFLGFMDCAAIETTCDTSNQLQFQYHLLHSAFPDFPASMLKTLLVREGSGTAVAKGLMDRGWKPSNYDTMRSLSDTNLDVLSIHYYWGELREEYLVTLKACPPGSYFSAWKTNVKSFVICRLNHKLEVIEKETASPIVVASQKRIFSLIKPLTKPDSIPLMSLVPFLRDIPADK